MNKIYESEQTGWLVANIFLLAMTIITIAYFYQLGNNPLPLAVFLGLMIIFFACFLSFYKLKIRIDSTGIHVIFGIGLIHIKIIPDEIITIKKVRTPWSEGIGIRITKKGMLYNIQGSEAVEILYLINGKQKIVQIGTKDASRLKHFLQTEYRLGK